MLKFDKTLLLMVLLLTVTYAVSVEGQEQTSDLSTRTPVSNVTDGSRNLSSFEMASKSEKNQGDSEPNQGFLYLATQVAVGGEVTIL
jgi:hypothetical protein